MTIQRPVTADQLVSRAEQLGFKIAHRSAWPTGAGWIAMTDKDSPEDHIDLMIKYYPGNQFTLEATETQSQSPKPKRRARVEELLQYVESRDHSPDAAVFPIDGFETGIATSS